MQTTERRARGVALTADHQTNTVGRTWSARFAAYPFWAFVEVKPDMIAGQPGYGSRYIDVLERSTATQEWKIAYDVLVEDAAVPSPLPDNVDATVTPTDLVAVAEALRPSAAYLSGVSPTPPSSAKILPALREALGRIVVDQTTVHTTCAPAGDVGAGGLTRAVRTPEGIFGTSILRCTKSSAANPGLEISWNEAHARAIGGDTRRVKTLVEVFDVALAALLRTDGSTTVVGGDLFPVPLTASST